ncbi:MAG: hypothetical protein LBD59_01100, partial [Prevotellaceae bacterium]|nr:hypothetical protein [Prevotellaceae bacterium]
MRTIILIIVLTALQFSLKAQVTEEYINSDPCMLFPSKYKRLSDSISKTPIDEISAIYIREYFRNQFLDFRMTETPGIPDSIKTYPTDIIGYTHYKNPKKVMLPDSINNLDLDMEVTMNRWPLDKPLPGFFLIEKEKNRFIHRNYYRKPHVIEKDVTLDIYDSLYLFDRYFLIYYYNWTNEYRGEETYNISGNLHYNTGHTEQWEKYICSDNWMMYARAAMYGVKEMPEWFSMGKENNIL